MDVSVIIVSYNTKNLLQDCIQSIAMQTKDVRYEIIVVDNNSTDGSREMIRERFPETILVCNEENVGFSRANNRAYRYSQGEHLLFLNSDTLMLDGAIEEMFGYMATHPQVGVVGPKILDSHRQPTRSYMKFLNLKILFLGSKYLKRFFDVERYRLHFPVYDYNSIHRVPWLSGACLMISRSVFSKAGLFDENYFLYLDDMDLCLQVSKLGSQIVYLPQAEIIHLFGGSSGADSTKLRQIHKESMKYYFKKNYSNLHYLIARAYLCVMQLMLEK